MHVVHDVSWMYCLTSLSYSQPIISVTSRVATRGGKDGTYQDDSTETWLHSASLWLWDVIWCFFFYAYFAITCICVCLCCQKLFISYIYNYIHVCTFLCIVKTVAGWGVDPTYDVYTYTYIYTYIPTYTTPIDAFVDFMPFASFRKSAGNKGREELNAKAGRKQAEIPGKSWFGQHGVHVLRILRSKPYQYTTKWKQDHLNICIEIWMFRKKTSEDQ